MLKIDLDLHHDHDINLNHDLQLDLHLHLYHDLYHDIDHDLDHDLDHGKKRHDKTWHDKAMYWYRSRSSYGNSIKGKARQGKEIHDQTK
jgi:hypothetical protein